MHLLFLLVALVSWVFALLAVGLFFVFSCERRVGIIFDGGISECGRKESLLLSAG